jgi:hypothetical protein
LFFLGKRSFGYDILVERIATAMYLTEKNLKLVAKLSALSTQDERGRKFVLFVSGSLC